MGKASVKACGETDDLRLIASSYTCYWKPNVTRLLSMHLARQLLKPDGLRSGVQIQLLWFPFTTPLDA